MNKSILLCFLSMLSASGFPQASVVYQRGLSAEENLKAINGLGPYNTGSVGFDNRYEGVRGTTRLLDTLLPSFVRLTGQDYYIDLHADIDLVQNTVIYVHPRTKKLFSIPVDIVSEIVIKKGDKELFFRTTIGKVFEKEMKPQRFCQILNDGQYQLIKIPLKKYIQADYKGAYTADRRYDEYVPDSKYYLISSDSVFHQIQLTRKALLKLFPGKKDLINQSDDEDAFQDKEEMILSILSKF